MNHQIFGHKLSRTKNERRRLLQSLARELIKHGQIKTTLAKAKAVQPLVEKLVTKAKEGSNSSISRVRQVLADKISVDKLLTDAKTRFANRTSGYTRIIKLAVRLSDASQMALLSFVDQVVDSEVIVPKTTVKKTALKRDVKVKKPVKSKVKIAPKK